MPTVSDGREGASVNCTFDEALGTVEQPVTASSNARTGAQRATGARLMPALRDVGRRPAAAAVGSW